MLPLASAHSFIGVFGVLGIYALTEWKKWVVDANHFLAWSLYGSISLLLALPQLMFLGQKSE